MKQVVYEQGALVFVSEGKFETTPRGSHLYGSGFEIYNLGQTVLLTRLELAWNIGSGSVLHASKDVFHAIVSGQKAIVLNAGELEELWDLALANTGIAGNTPSSNEAFRLTVHAITEHGRLQIGPLECLTTYSKDSLVVAYAPPPAAEPATD